MTQVHRNDCDFEIDGLEVSMIAPQLKGFYDYMDKGKGFELNKNLNDKLQYLYLFSAAVYAFDTIKDDINKCLFYANLKKLYVKMYREQYEKNNKFLTFMYSKSHYKNMVIFSLDQFLLHFDVEMGIIFDVYTKRIRNMTYDKDYDNNKEKRDIVRTFKFLYYYSTLGVTV
jgi:hypothetical protein